MDWEFDILYAIQSIRTPFLDKVMAFLSTIGDAGVLWIVIGVVLCVSKKYRRGGMQMLSAELLSFIVGSDTYVYRQKNGNTGDCTCGTYSVFAYVQLHAFPNVCPGRSSAWGGIGCVCELFV